MVEFLVSGQHSECNSLFESEFVGGKDTRRIQVQMYSLEKLFEIHGFSQVSLVKMDIEGAEFDVIKEDNQLFAGIDYILGEFHEFAGETKALLARLNKFGYREIYRNDKSREDLPIVHVTRL